MRFLAVLLVLTFLGCAKDTPPPSPGAMLRNKKDVTKAAREKKYQDGAQDMAPDEPQAVGMNRANPFLTVEEEKAFGKNSREVLTNLKLSAIFNSAKNSYAIVDGKIVKINDKIYDKEVVEINRDNVILKDAGREYIVNLRMR